MAITFVNTGTEVTGSTSLTPGIPASVTAGDLMVLWVNHKGGGNVAAPTGWTLIENFVYSSTGPGLIATFYRVFVAGDTAPSVTGLTSSSCGVITAYRGASYGANIINAVSGAPSTAVNLTTTGGSGLAATNTSDWVVAALPLDNDGLPLTSLVMEFPSGTGVTANRRTTDALETVTGTDCGMSVQDCVAGTTVASQLKITGTLNAASVYGIYGFKLTDTSPTPPVRPAPTRLARQAVMRASIY